MPLRSPIFASPLPGALASPVVDRSTPLIGIVGPCAAGKSTLAANLKQYGYPRVRHIAQEHSYVPDMWQRVTNPDLLIFLEVSYSLTRSRRKMSWTEAEYVEQLHRLRHARQHAHLILQTDNLSPAQVLQKVLEFLHTT